MLKKKYLNICKMMIFELLIYKGLKNLNIDQLVLK